MAVVSNSRSVDAFGPLVVAPMSELYGRMPVYHTTNILFVVFTAACGVSTNLNMFIGFRLLEGIAGSAAITMGAGTCADMFEAKERGRAIALWSMGPLLGPVRPLKLNGRSNQANKLHRSLAPSGGGFLCEAKGWRWVFWVLCMAMALVIILMFLLFRETYAPVILEKKAQGLRKATGNQLLRSKLDTGHSSSQAFTLAIVRPLKMLFLSPIIAILAMYTAIVYGYLYLLFTTFTVVFEGIYGFPPSIVGLSFLGLGLGMFLGLTAFYIFSDKIMNQKATASDGKLKPEHRFILVIPGAAIVPVGFFIYGWSAQYGVFWM